MASERPAFVPPEWHSGEDANSIQARMMTALPPDIDNTEAGFPFDFTIPTALEADELINFWLMEAIKLIFPAWSYGRWLDLHAARSGVVRRPANAATGTVTITGVPGTVVPAGTVLAVPAVGSTPAIEFSTDARATIPAASGGATYGTVTVSVTAVVAGPTGNVAADTIVIMAQPISGIASISNAEAITGGTEEESDESLYERIQEAEQNTESFIGNDADYIRWGHEVPAVGTVVVDDDYEVTHPGWVHLLIMDENGEPANATIITNVYNHIMRPDSPIERLAPTGSHLLVEAPGPANLVIVVTGISLDSADVTTADIVKRFKAAMLDYFVEAKADGVVRYNNVHAIFTDVDGVLDFDTLTVNGDTQNVDISGGQYPVITGVTIT